jgi:hypothetical protein
MALQAYVDDSKTGEEVLVLAGYIAPADRWQQFSLEWDFLLKESPTWVEFKMKHAIRYPARSERFYRLVERYAVAFVVCLIEIRALRQLFEEMELPPLFTNPYNFAFRAITDATYQELHLLNIHDKVEFIFDKRGEEKFVQSGWDFYERTIPAEQRARIVGIPKFQESVDVLPLQAAEIIAWNTRKHWLKHRNISDPIELPWPELRQIPGHKVHWNYDAIRPNLERLRALFLELGLVPRPRWTVTKKVTFSFGRGPSDSGFGQ